MVVGMKQKLRGRIAVLAGGHSAERDISLQSGSAVFAALQAAHFDVLLIDTQDVNWMDQLRQHNVRHTFIALHGGDGENGTLQGALAVLGVTYTGSGVLGSALAIDKMRSKQLWRGVGVPTADYVQLTEAADWSSLIKALGGKCIVKPAQEGSSIGMHIAGDAYSLQQAFAEAQKYGAVVMAERWIAGPEYTVGILGSDALPIIELQTDNSFYDFSAKYLADDTRYLCPCDLSPEQDSLIKKIAWDAFSSLSCSGWGRVDIMLDAASKQPYVLEVNTAPGMTSHSLVPMAAKAQGMNFGELVVQILNLSLEQQ